VWKSSFPMLNTLLLESQPSEASYTRGIKQPESLVNLYTSSLSTDDQFPDHVTNTSIDNEVHAIV
jgi:hypothetical protein